VGQSQRKAERIKMHKTPFGSLQRYRRIEKTGWTCKEQPKPDWAFPGGVHGGRGTRYGHLEWWGLDSQRGGGHVDGQNGLSQGSGRNGQGAMVWGIKAGSG
jgi:hypothetical protein